MFGYTEDEIISVGIQDILTPVSYAKQKGRLLQVLESGRTSSEMMELEVIHKDGHTLPVEINANFILDEKGIPVEILGVARNITDRKKAEKALQESERKYQDLYDNAPDMFVSVDATKRNILECNRTFVEALGYTKEEVIGRPVFDIYTPDSAEYAKSTIFPLFLKTGLMDSGGVRLVFLEIHKWAPRPSMTSFGMINTYGVTKTINCCVNFLGSRENVPVDGIPRVAPKYT